MNSLTRMPAIFLPHGGGPWPLLDGPLARGHDRLAEHLRGIADTIAARPRAILMISAHWDEPVPTVMAAAHPPMLYDYTNFPEHTYRVRYAAPGSPELAARIGQLLDAAGIANAVDRERGFDHGAFVPLMVAYPDADIPVVQVSLRSDLDPEAHLAIGRALAPLRDEGVLVVGSGMSFHNMRAFFNKSGAVLQAASEFDRWLAQTVLQTDAAARDASLVLWAEAPGGRIAHPEHDHLVPLFVVAGAAAGDTATHSFGDDVLGYPVSGFRFG
jgi:aromatic ring-opening dioxygenase catalytic subunit (LigB family)